MGETKRKRKKPVPETVAPFLAPLLALQELLSKFDDQGVIIGGVAASLLGTPRFTVDVDAVLLLSIEDLPTLIFEAANQGIEPRIPDAVSFARKNRVLLLRHTSSGIDIDISLGSLPFEAELVERSKIMEIGTLKLRLPAPEDLIIMKAVAHRPQDLEDIRAVAASQPVLDQERIKFWIDQFGDALDQPELWNEIYRLL